MTFSIDAVYENGLLRLDGPLPLAPLAKVRVTVHAGDAGPESSVGVIPCRDSELIEWAALDPELEFPPPRVNS